MSINLLIIGVLLQVLATHQTLLPNMEEKLALGEGGIICPPDIKTYTRLNGVKWCGRIYPLQMTYDGAKNICEWFGGTLTGFDNAAQRKIAADNAKKTLTQMGLTSGAFWIGAYRKKECQVSNWKKVKACLPAEKNSFEWIDGNTTSTDGFNFRKGQPDYNMGNQNAVYMVVGEDVVDRYGVWKNEEMDDVRADLIKNPRSPGRNIVGFICGFPAL
ncbi:unnamed protein product [Caenorhabditis bovis]|uniref:C-type lectin domain-containing protein n=1 Tax=Caenorhabditis bovis TaxID=2654633 RepID=A0A8S1EFX0_9PELO|nr:unnamed protein product [Caenorhabditis bovis]